jgi:adenylosuccinate lyase
MPSLITLTSKLKDLSIEWKDIPMLARTHRQTGSYRLGKEIAFL